MDYKHIYTDGSKDDMKVGCAVVSDDFSETMRIPDGSSIFTAEAKALDLALDLIADCETEGAQWLSGRVLDSRPKGRGFEPHRRHCVVVLEQDTFILA